MGFEYGAVNESERNWSISKSADFQSGTDFIRFLNNSFRKMDTMEFLHRLFSGVSQSCEPKFVFVFLLAPHRPSSTTLPIFYLWKRIHLWSTKNLTERQARKKVLIYSVLVQCALLSERCVRPLVCSEMNYGERTYP